VLAPVCDVHAWLTIAQPGEMTSCTVHGVATAAR
jgi:hypothetical protein